MVDKKGEAMTDETRQDFLPHETEVGSCIFCHTPIHMLYGELRCEGAVDVYERTRDGAKEYGCSICAVLCSSCGLFVEIGSHEHKKMHTVVGDGDHLYCPKCAAEQAAQDAKDWRV